MGMEPYQGPWDELIYPPQHGMAGQSIDLAFRLNMDYGTGVPDDVVPKPRFMTKGLLMALTAARSPGSSSDSGRTVDSDESMAPLLK